MNSEMYYYKKKSCYNFQCDTLAYFIRRKQYRFFDTFKLINIKSPKRCNLHIISNYRKDNYTNG